MKTSLLFNKRLRQKPQSIWPKRCTCNNYVWAELPKDTKVTKEAFWFNCPKCNSTAIVERVQHDY